MIRALAGTGVASHDTLAHLHESRLFLQRPEENLPNQPTSKADEACNDGSVSAETHYFLNRHDSSDICARSPWPQHAIFTNPVSTHDGIDKEALADSHLNFPDTVISIIETLKDNFELSPSTAPPILRVVKRILGHQNKHGGWGVDGVRPGYNSHLSLMKKNVPFIGRANPRTASIASVTGLVLEAFGLLVQSNPNGDVITPGLIDRMNAASNRAIYYLARVQEANGAWCGWSGSRCMHSTRNVIRGLAYFAVRCTDGVTIEHDELAKDCVKAAKDWLETLRDADWD